MKRAVLARAIHALVTMGCGLRVSLGELDDGALPTEPDPDAGVAPGEAGAARVESGPPREGSSGDGGEPRDASGGDVTEPHDASPEAAPPDGGAWSPCLGKICGEPCRRCPPTQLSCIESAELKACDPTGRCVSAPATCS